MSIVIFYSTKRIQSFIPSWIATSLVFIGFIWVDRRCGPATVDLAPTEIIIQAWHEGTIDAGACWSRESQFASRELLTAGVMGHYTFRNLKQRTTEIVSLHKIFLKPNLFEFHLLRRASIPLSRRLIIYHRALTTNRKMCGFYLRKLSKQFPVFLHQLFYFCFRSPIFIKPYCIVDVVGRIIVVSLSKMKFSTTLVG